MILCVSFRILPLFLCFFFLCHQFSLNATITFAAVGISLWVLLTLPLGSGPDVLGLGLLAMLYVAQQWILGWPDRPEILEPQARHEDRGEHLQEYIGAVAVASSPLRPVGRVALDGEEYEARSELGFVDAGARVKITGREGMALRVRPAGDD